jgi:F0F1-type ATP synthase membrane subunit b/b'
MALIERNDQEHFQENVRTFVALLSQRNVGDLDQSVIRVALKDAGGEENLSNDALHAVNEALGVLVEYSSGKIENTYDANQRLVLLAERIRNNRGSVSALAADIKGTVSLLRTGAATVVTTGALYIHWNNFIYALKNIYTIAATPAGIVALSGGASNIKILLPEGNTTWWQYLSVVCSPSQMEAILPSKQVLESAFQSTIGKAVPSNFISKMIYTGTEFVNTFLSGAPSALVDVGVTEVKYAHEQIGNYANVASRSLQGTKNLFIGWIAVLVIVFIVYAFIHVYRGCRTGKCKQEFNKKIGVLLENAAPAAHHRQLEYLFKSKKSAKKAKKSPKKSATKAKKSPKKSAKKAKKSPKKSAKKAKKSPKKSAKKAKKSPKKSVKKAKRSVKK